MPQVSADQITSTDREFFKQTYELLQNYVSHFEAVEIKDALKVAMEISSLGNR